VTAVDLTFEYGWFGRFSRAQAQGDDVIPNGTLVEKASAETGVPRGTLGNVLGSAYFDEARGGLFSDGGDRLVYFVEWASAPNVAMCVHAHRVKRV
jgi:hypothetical protein